MSNGNAAAVALESLLSPHWVPLASGRLPLLRAARPASDGLVVCGGAVNGQPRGGRRGAYAVKHGVRGPHFAVLASWLRRGGVLSEMLVATSDMSWPLRLASGGGTTAANAVS